MKNLHKLNDDAFEALARDLMQLAVENYRRDGLVVPVAIIPTEETEVIIELSSAIDEVREQASSLGDSVSEDLIQALGKRLFAQKIRLITKRDAAIVATCMESWVASAEVNKGETPEAARQRIQGLYEEYGSMENWPDDMCASAIVVTVEHRDGRQLVLMTEYDPETGEIRKTHKPIFEATGRLTTWFSENRDDDDSVN